MSVLVLGLMPGCFNNIQSSATSSSRSSLGQGGGSLNDTGFSSEVGDIDVDGVLIGSYQDTSNVNRYGILVDLQRSLVNSIGSSSLQGILDNIDANNAIQNRKLIIHLPAFGIKATTTLAKVAMGNSKKLRNVMNIRPGLSRVDFTTSALEIPESPSVLQLNNSNKTVVTYGGRIEGDYVRRMALLIPYAGANAGFLPSSSISTWGDGYPTASPEEYAGGVKLTRVTAEIATLFGQILTNPPYGADVSNSVQSDSIRAINQTYGSLGLAVHYKMDPATGLPTTTVDAAYFININPGNSSGPETFTFCHSGYNSQDQFLTFGNGSGFEFSHPLACECQPGLKVDPMVAGDPAVPISNIFREHCPTTNNKLGLITNAIAAANAQPGPTSGILVPPAAPVNDVLFEVN